MTARRALVPTLVVGGTWDLAVRKVVPHLRDHGLDVVDHWPEKTRGGTLRAEVGCIFVMTDICGHYLFEQAQKAVGDKPIPIINGVRKWSIAQSRVVAAGFLPLSQNEVEQMSVPTHDEIRSFYVEQLRHKPSMTNEELVKAQRQKYPDGGGIRTGLAASARREVGVRPVPLNGGGSRVPGVPSNHELYIREYTRLLTAYKTTGRSPPSAQVLHKEANAALAEKGIKLAWEHPVYKDYTRIRGELFPPVVTVSGLPTPKPVEAKPAPKPVDPPKPAVAEVKPAPKPIPPPSPVVVPPTPPPAVVAPAPAPKPTSPPKSSTPDLSALVSLVRDEMAQHGISYLEIGPAGVTIERTIVERVKLDL